MTTHRDVHGALARPHGLRLLWVVLAALAAVFCALVMIGMLSWAEDERNWFVFAFAGFGVVGFATTAVEQWQDRPRGEESRFSLWLAAAFWAAFGLYQVFSVVYGIAITESDTNWGMVGIVAVLGVAMLWWAFHYARRARQTD